jgi:GNAT superfamily N-acetyltransferase
MSFGTHNVAPHGRRRGLARQLIDDSAAWARALGARRLNITIAPIGIDVSHLLLMPAATWRRRFQPRRTARV